MRCKSTLFGQFRVCIRQNKNYTELGVLYREKPVNRCTVGYFDYQNMSQLVP